MLRKGAIRPRSSRLAFLLLGLLLGHAIGADEAVLGGESKEPPTPPVGYDSKTEG